MVTPSAVVLIRFVRTRGGARSCQPRVPRRRRRRRGRGGSLPVRVDRRAAGRAAGRPGGRAVPIRAGPGPRGGTPHVTEGQLQPARQRLTGSADGDVVLLPGWCHDSDLTSPAAPG